MKALEAFSIRDLQTALQVNYLMNQHGISAQALRQELTHRFDARQSATARRPGNGKTVPSGPASFIASGLWPPPARSSQRKEWLKKLSKQQRHDYKAWKKERLASADYGRKKP